MKLATILAALTAATIGTASVTLAQTSSAPPPPKPAAGALPNPNANAVQKSFRTQNATEQQQSSASQAPRDVIPAGSSRN
jgi:hypothetical protein